MNDDQNPFATLLAEHQSTKTDLDIHFEKTFSSLKSSIVKKEHSEEENPIIVFDKHSDTDSSSQQIGLSVRQPSFVSLQGHIIPKGSDSLAGFVPNIEEIVPIQVEDSGYDESSDGDPNVEIVKELSKKNMGRWKAMGYEPPEDLIPLVRAASVAMIKNSAAIHHQRTGSVVTSFSTIERSVWKPVVQPTVTPILEDHKITPSKRPRSNSFGNDDGENNKTSTMMETILSKSPSKTSYSPLIGRLSEIVTEKPETELYSYLMNSSNKIGKNTISRLKEYQNLCKQKNYLEEYEYLTKIIPHSPKHTSYQLPIELPKPIDRSKDVKVLHVITDLLMRGKPISKINIPNLYSIVD